MELIKVVIIDDDEIIREGMANTVPWETLGFKIIGEADNGVMGIAVIEKLKPDLVVLDIKMPHMDGIELSSWIYEHYPIIKVLMLSAHNDFEYARHAIKVNVIDYVLKPVYKPDFINVLKKVKEQLVEEHNNRLLKKSGRQRYINDLMMRIIFNSEIEEVSELLMNDELFKSANFKKMSIVLFECKGAVALQISSLIKILPKELLEQSIFFQLKENVIGLLVEWVGNGRLRIKIRRIKDHLQEVTSVEVKVGIGNYTTSIKDIKKSYAEAYASVRYCFYIEKTLVMYKEVGEYQYDYNYPIELEEAIYQSLIENDSQLLGKLIDQFFKLFEEPNFVQRKVIMNNCLTLLVNIERRILIQNQQSVVVSPNDRIGVEELMDLSTLVEVKNVITENLEAMARYVEEMDTDSDNKIIAMAVECMKKTYATATLKSVSRELAISPNHLSFLFKIERGESFKDVLTDIRIDRAKVLLKSGNLKTYEIAEKVGYKDPRHFSKVFKKHTGLLPKNY